jgi:hypothetical protein
VNPSPVILFADSGELGNRLVSYCYLLAFGAEHRVPVANPCFWRYAHLFDRANRIVERPWLPADPARHANGRKIERLLSLPGFHSLRRRFEFDGGLVCAPRALVARSLVATAARCPGIIARGAQLSGYIIREESQWQHRCALLQPRSTEASPFGDPALPVKHAALFREQFQLTPPLRAQLAEYLAPLRQRYQRLVGIHIRRGDYVRYREGQWFFDNATYRRLIVHLQSLFPGETVGFIVATNEPFPADDFASLPTHAGPGHFALDMYALAGCDLIAGPPSTFSGWASFVGNRPVYFLTDKDKLPTRNDLGEVWAPRFY